MAYSDTLGHLIELRSRLIKVVLGIMVALGVTVPFANQLHHFFVSPLLSQLPVNGQMIATTVTSPFLIPLKIAFYVALVISLPNTLYQLWKFVQPGLYPREKLISAIGIFSSILLFLAGASFAFYVVIPIVFKFVIGSAPEGVAVMTEIGNYLDFLISIIMAFGFSFQLPIIVIALACMEIVELKTLSEIRSYVIVGAFVIGAIFTPPDIISQFLLAIPLWMLYELGLLVSRLIISKRQQESAAVPAN
jgi:sec-independent protein translocase protein TatC